MLDKLLKLDHQLFLTLNGEGPPWMDAPMRLASEIWIWFPVFAGIIFLLVRKDQRKGLILVLFLFLTLVLTEQISVNVFKEGIQRLRPCHQPDLTKQIRLVADHCGGRYGFVSTHATNAFGIILFSLLHIKKYWFVLAGLAWAMIVSYSRIHLGVHFPGDVAGGILLGSLIGLFTFILSKKILKAPYLNEKKD